MWGWYREYRRVAGVDAHEMRYSGWWNSSGGGGVIVMVDVGVTTPPNQCSKRIKIKSQKVFGTNCYVSGSYRRKTETGAFLQ